LKISVINTVIDISIIKILKSLPNPKEAILKGKKTLKAAPILRRRFAVAG